MNDNNITPDQQAMLDRFVRQNKLFYAPDPAIMENHRIDPRSEIEQRLLSGEVDPHKINEVRGLIISALDESNTMIEQMGAAPGAKWGDMTTGIFTAAGDLSMIAPHGVGGFAAAVFYPIKFINKYWTDEPTVGVREGDGFIHNDARYGGIHNTDQSMMMPVFWDGQLVCWVSATIHEGENGATEPGGMPAAAESKFDEGLKMSPFKVVENFELKRDLVTFLQNSVRDPKLQLEDMKVRLHSCLRLRERVVKLLEEHGAEALIMTLRKHIEDVVDEVRRRILELPDGTMRTVSFADSTLRESALLKLNMAITVKGDKLTVDMRGSSPELVNRSINTCQASFKTMLYSGWMQNVWPDLPFTMAVFTPFDFVFDEKSIVNGSFDTPQAMSLIPLFKTMTIASIPMAKFNYSLPNRYTAMVAPQYDQPATLIYGGITQHNEFTGNFCADINGMGQGGRSHRDGEHSVSPPFAAHCDLGEIELMEEDLPLVRLGAFTLTKDRAGFGKQRSGLGYEQIHTFRGSALWGYMTGCTGSLFPSAQPLFGGYASPAYPLCKIKGINVFDELQKNPERVPFDIVRLMNERAIEGATYSTHPSAMTFELAQPGEVYMLCQGAGGGYGDVLQRDPALVMKDLEEQLISDDTARDIFKVAYDSASRLVDEQGTRALREQERRARIARGKPFDEFVKTWSTPEPPAHLPYMGCWGADVNTVYGIMMGERVKMSATALQSQFMLNPKDVRIAQLEAEVAALKRAG
ncbi:MULTISPECIES: hydantoinase B/oxoprolinase family protein [Hydrocarboniphaga]|uniref:Hydantoinase B/oxoprolinase n=1 Tax=Hydrocarboniphaga effusa AP103 TaxID=1172194 RepID=I8I411_9GAMM|nr:MULTISPECIES: hydantoinase B/oxoprolinase family protein [Hydrocarboniphaga]EIT70881.1 hydantoinase B/oxoprolinase [Hydrocarboniphaga effusa AP103]MDZ4077792.1 hydantoinase B/oxoprolinase family protein [Hydrocarboniphaga sp.]